MNDSFFKKIEAKTGVPMDEIFALANAIQFADFKDEDQVRKIIKKVSQVANKDVPQLVEDELVNSIVTSGKGLNLNDISQLLGGN